jgi:ABC-type polysaccharide/polyol phosphate transport system ATPase subunit
MQELRRSGKTMLCVSHSPELLAKMCDRAVWLDHGQVIADGKIGEVVDAYQGRRSRAGTLQTGTPAEADAAG